MPTMPSSRATPAAITSKTIVNAVCAEAESSTSCSVLTCASASFGSTSLTARRAAGARFCGGTDVRMTKLIAPRGGTMFMMRAPINGMYIFGTGVGSASARVGVFATTPTIVSQPNEEANDGFPMRIR